LNKDPISLKSNNYQVSLVAYYGSKPTALESLIRQCQKVMKDTLGDTFYKYDIKQVHATLIGLEKKRSSLFYNRNFARYRKLHVTMDLPGFRHYLLTSGILPFDIQFGGFSDREHPIRSRGKHPYERSFSIQGDKAVIIGWPRQKMASCVTLNPSEFSADGPNKYPDTLDRLRRTAQNFNILHTWHKNADDVDNDFYLRIGLVREMSPDTRLKSKIEDTIRMFLQQRGPVIMKVEPSDLFLVSYVDETLPPDSTKAWQLNDNTLNGYKLYALYS